MKQGSGNSSSGAQKREPIGHKIEPSYAGNIGLAQSPRMAAMMPTYPKEGVMCPEPAAVTYHHKGSQKGS